MEDFFERYKKKKILNHLSVFGLALMLALGVHLTLLSGDTGQKISASILDATSTAQDQVQKADIYAELTDDVLIVRNSQEIHNLDTISFTIAYNPELGTLKSEQIGGPDIEAQALENEPGLIFIQLMSLNEQDLPAESIITRLPYETLREGRQVFNLIQASFTDSEGETYFLTSSGTGL